MERYFDLNVEFSGRRYDRRINAIWVWMYSPLPIFELLYAMLISVALKSMEWRIARAIINTYYFNRTQLLKTSAHNATVCITYNIGRESNDNKMTMIHSNSPLAAIKVPKIRFAYHNMLSHMAAVWISAVLADIKC